MVAPTPIAVGDVVRSRRGGPLMLVAAVVTSDEGHQSYVCVRVHEVEVLWFEFWLEDLELLLRASDLARPDLARPAL